MRGFLTLLVLLAWPGVVLAADTDEMSQRERTEIEQRFRRAGPERPSRLPVDLLAAISDQPTPTEELPPARPSLRRSRPAKPAGDANAQEPRAAPELATEVAVAVAVPAAAPINTLPDLPISGPLPADQFSFTYEGLRDRDTDCVLLHERLDRTARERFSRFCNPAQDSAIGVQTRMVGAGVPAFTTR